ncbi:MAG: alpha/beta hydrolase [Balneolaceae bacterium]|nr:MAG: alpha/beta hydrolase [Balneolaceae bacterium]
MLVILHGWSDNAGSFGSLAKKLSKPAPDGIGAEIKEVRLGDYISLDDRVRFDDLADALARAWDDQNLPTDPRSVDAIVHSTGGLVLRHWMVRNFLPGEAPVKRLLMLAPANFGSPLAHTGRSFFGRAVKGWKGTRLFETGRHILKGLELASPFTWNLAMADLLGEGRYFGPGAVLCTVLTGNAGFKGIASIANKAGSDGVVRVASANLNANKLSLDFSDFPDQWVLTTDEASHSSAAFGIMDREDHSTIAGKNRGPRNRETWPFFRDALLVEDESFETWQQKLQAHNEAVSKAAERRRGSHSDSYQNLVVQVSDTHGQPVQDYLIEFYMNDDHSRRDQGLTQRLQEEVITNVHTCSEDASSRAMLINCTRLYKLFSREGDRLNISITAFPDINIRKNLVGYKTYTDNDIGSLSLSREQLASLFRPHATTLLSVKIRRYQDEKVFRFRKV